MPTPIDLYWSFRSPYSYLALKNIKALAARRDVKFNLKIVLPLAIRDPDFFNTHGPEWVAYLLRDVFRMAQMTGQIIAIPNPDPVASNPETGSYDVEQPYIWRLARLGLLATDAGKGLEFIDDVSQLIWSGKEWNAPGVLENVVTNIGLDLSALDAEAITRAEALDARLASNDKDLRAAGHWGVPTCVLAGEPFFGTDRLDALEWRLDQIGTP